MQRTRAFVAVLCAAFLATRAAPAPADEESLVLDASFEDGDTRPGPTWELSEGARDGDTEQKSEVALDREHVRHGKASLRLSGGMGTTSWQIVRQSVPALQGQRVTLVVAAMSVNVRKEGRQYPNANALLEFVDAAGARVGMVWTPTVPPTHDWCDLRVTTIAPERSSAAWVGLFLSQSGTVWFDDVRLTVAPASGADPAGRAAAFEVLESHLRSTYPSFGLGSRPHADALFAKWRPVCLAAKDEEAFVRSLRTMLGDLDDPHVWFRRGGKSVGTHTPVAIRPNLDPAARRAALTEVLDEKPPLVVGRIGAGESAVGYVEIASWQADEPAAARIEAALDSLASCRALVIDVRANSGGDEAVAQRVMSRFAAADVVYARSKVREPFAAAGDAFLPPIDRVLAARKGAPPDARPVAVLQGRWCMSSCEGFLLMARALPSVTTVGDRSRGASGNPKPVVVLPDLTVHSSTWQALTPEGETIELRGVAPEVEVKEVPAGGRDPVLAKALEVLAR